MKLTEHEWVMLSHLLDQALELPEAAHEQWLESLAEPFVCLKPTLRAMLAQQRTPAPDAFLNTLPTFTGVPALAPDAIAPVEPGVAIGPIPSARRWDRAVWVPCGLPNVPMVW